MTEHATPTAADAPPAVHRFRLDNGLEGVVIPDHRGPVVTHMLWYRNGGADDPAGRSGIAHFLEHLMFKGTQAHPAGAFSRAVADVGGEENAFTSLDVTAYYQKVASEHLGAMMAFEADRMRGLTLTDAVVAPEREVVREERRLRVDADPSSQLQEAIGAALFTNHPYGRPIIGFDHEVAALSREDALAHYRRFYAPANAVLVVAGDVEPGAVEALARDTYGRLNGGEVVPRRRPQEPEPVAARRLTLADPRVEQPSFHRAYLAPSYVTDPALAPALDVLAQVLGGGPTSRLHRALVVEGLRASSASAWYMGMVLDRSCLGVDAEPREGVALEALEAAVDAVLERLREEPVPAAELERAKTRLVAEAVYARDSQGMMARTYGGALAIGLTAQDVEAWPARIEAVTAGALRGAARRCLAPRLSVTGHLVGAPAPAPAPAPEGDAARRAVA